MPVLQNGLQKAEIDFGLFSDISFIHIRHHFINRSYKISCAQPPIITLFAFCHNIIDQLVALNATLYQQIFPVHHHTAQGKRFKYLLFHIFRLQYILVQVHQADATKKKNPQSRMGLRIFW